jgi:hypothetical protein
VLHCTLLVIDRPRARQITETIPTRNDSRDKRQVAITRPVLRLVRGRGRVITPIQHSSGEPRGIIGHGFGGVTCHTPELDGMRILRDGRADSELVLGRTARLDTRARNGFPAGVEKIGPRVRRET